MIVSMPKSSNPTNRNRADLSQFLVHLTKNGSYPSYKASKRGGYYFTEVPVQAKASLDLILSMNKIEARSPYGYFKLKISYPTKSRGPVQPDWIRSICFSETPLSELKFFYGAVVAKRNAYQKYGLGFWSDKLRAKGVNPIFYLDSRNKTYLSALDAMVTPNNISSFQPTLFLHKTFGPLVTRQTGYSDFKWEREWRKLGDLLLADEDIAFGICSEEEISLYQAQVKNRFPFIDPDWDEVTLREHLKRFGASALLDAL